MKCGECRKEFDQSENIAISYKGSTEHNHCTIDCALQHVMLEVFADDRPIRDILEILTEAKRIHEENL